MKATSEPGLFELGMSARAHVGKSAPDLPGKFMKFILKNPCVDFLVPDPAPAANSSKRAPFVLMHMPKRGARTRFAVEELATAVDVAHTPTDAPSAGNVGAAAGGTGEGGGGAQDIEQALASLALRDSCAHCGAQGAVELKRCSRCKRAAYCGAACQKAGWKAHRKTCSPPLAPETCAPETRNPKP
jgi:hypothetical protein